MFRLRLSLAFAVLVALVCGQAGWVYWGANRVDDFARHSRLTGDILAELLELSASKQRLRVWAAQQLMDAGALPATRNHLLDEMRSGASRLDALRSVISNRGSRSPRATASRCRPRLTSSSTSASCSTTTSSS